MSAGKDAALRGPRRACLQVAHQSSPLRYGVRDDTPGAAQPFTHQSQRVDVVQRPRKNGVKDEETEREDRADSHRDGGRETQG